MRGVSTKGPLTLISTHTRFKSQENCLDNVSIEIISRSVG